MRTCLFLCSIVALASASTLRYHRDVSEFGKQPGYNYLLPQDPNSSTKQATAVLTNNGYEYKTVKSLRYRFRHRRDVSHVNREYLPPVPAPSIDYLPPFESSTSKSSEIISNEYLPPVEETTSAEVAEKVNKEYLPPTESEVETKEATTEATVTVTEAPEISTDESGEELADATTSTISTIDTSREEDDDSVPEIKSAENTLEEDDTAVLKEDGYHYKYPDFIPNLGVLPLEPDLATPKNALEQEDLASEPVSQEIDSEVQKVVEEPAIDAPESFANEYLPPLDETHIAEGPEEDTAILANDGYHYRAIKRFRF